MNVRVENKFPKDQMQKPTHPLQTANGLTTQQTCAGTAQARVIHPKVTKLKTQATQQTRVKNQERIHKMPKFCPRESFTLKTSKLHWSPIILATQCVKSDPRTIFYHAFERICKRVPSVLWQHQIETAYI